MDEACCLPFTICKNTRHQSLEIPANWVTAHILFLSIYKMLRQFEVLPRFSAHILLFKRWGNVHSARLETKILPQAHEGHEFCYMSISFFVTFACPVECGAYSSGVPFCGFIIFQLQNS